MARKQMRGKARVVPEAVAVRLPLRLFVPQELTKTDDTCTPTSLCERGSRRAPYLRA